MWFFSTGLFDLPVCVSQEDISCLMTEFQHQKRKLEDQICKMTYNKSRITVGDVNIHCLFINDQFIRNQSYDVCII